MKTNSGVETVASVTSRKMFLVAAVMTVVFSLSLAGEAGADRGSAAMKAAPSTSIDRSDVQARVKGGAGEPVGYMKKKRQRKRSWPMTIRVAEDSTDIYAENFYLDTSPGQFDTEDPTVATLAWEDFYQDGCERIDRSRISCFWRVESDWVDVFDTEGSGGYLYTDYYVCEGELEVWYPRAVKKSLKEKASRPDCYWDTVDDGSDGEE